MAGPHAGNRNRPAYSGQARFRFPKPIIELFAPRKPLLFKPPPRKHRLRPMTGLSAYVSKFSDPSAPRALPQGDADGSAEKNAVDTAMPSDPAVQTDALNATQSAAETVGKSIQDTDKLMKDAGSAVEMLHSKPETMSIDNNDVSPSATTSKFETPAKRRRRKRESARRVAAMRAEEAAKSWDPHSKTGPRKTEDAFNTLFVSGFPRATLPARLRAEFEAYGLVRDVIIPRDRAGVPRGYAFVEFERERDFRTALKEARGRKIDGARISVDVERGRTVKGWKPNRCDGPFNSAAHSRSKISTQKMDVALPPPAFVPSQRWGR